MKHKTPLTSAAADYVFKFYKEKFPKNYLYHDYKHFLETVQYADEIGSSYDLDKDDLETLHLAAWFHDLGYSETYKNHEEVSATLAENFLRAEGAPEEKIAKVKSLVLSTDIKHKSQNQLEEILHDADLIALGRKNFFSKAQLLRLEWEAFLDKHYTDEEWEKIQLDFLINNDFYTKYALKKYGAQRIENIEQQTKILKKQTANYEKVKAKQMQQPKRGVETMYRATYRNHINLSAIADNKANMMISINTIIMSIIISVMGSGFTFYSRDSFNSFRFVLPMCILLIASLASVIFSVLSARPNVTQRDVSEKNVKAKKGSLLFFGNFVSLPLHSFVDQMHDLMNDKDLLYDSMSVDIYDLGLVLTRKYKLLRISYTIFMVGLILTVLAFLWVFLNTWQTT